jgi:hypothetical protein
VQGGRWVSGAVGLFTDDAVKLQTANEDFALWLIIRAAKIIIFEQAVAHPPKQQ